MIWSKSDVIALVWDSPLNDMDLSKNLECIGSVRGGMLLLCLHSIIAPGIAQTALTPPGTRVLKKMSLEELMNIEVTWRY